MNTLSLRRLVGIALAGALLLAGAAQAQVNLLWYKEVAKDGRIYVFNDPNKFKAFEASGEMGVSLTRLNYGPNGETVVFDNEPALDLYNFKHGKEAEVRAYTPPKAPAPGLPTSLKVGDGELKFGLLLQGWYAMDDSAPSTGSSWLGNTTGYNTFRIRRAEIKLNGKITPAWGFEVMLDPSKSISPQTSGTDGKILQDLAITYVGLKGHEFALGQKKIALTEEGVRSSSELDFAERAQVTRNLSDRRETGLFYKGEFSELVGAMASITNGTASNVSSDSNDTLFMAARIDVKPIPGLVFGASGGTGQVGGGAGHLKRERVFGHVRYVGGADLPLIFEAEYGQATDGQAGKADLKRDGWYASALYTFEKQFQLGVRYDEFDANKDVDGNKTKTLTAGFHYLVKGKNINLKADYFNIKVDNRKVNGVLDEAYNQFVLAAQVAF